MCARFLSLLVRGFLVLAALSFVAAAQQRPDNDTTRQELKTFDQFLDSHPQIATDLQKNPNLVNDANYLNAHPQLKDFLEDHPRVREEIKENPSAFMQGERRFERHEGERDHNGAKQRDKDKDKDKDNDRDKDKDHDR